MDQWTDGRGKTKSLELLISKMVELQNKHVD